MKKLKTDNVKRFIPNFITSLRFPGSIYLLFLDAGIQLLSSFWVLYLILALTDVADGYLARRFHVTSKMGGRFDSLADITFTICCTCKLFPFFTFAPLFWIWIGIIFSIKVFSLIWAFGRYGNIVLLHTRANRLTGFLLFVCLPLYVCFEAVIPLYVIALLATYAALEEWFLIRKRKTDCA